MADGAGGAYPIGLTEKGHYVVAPTLSGLCERSHLASDAIDLSTHINDVAGEIEWKDLNGIVLVGHSYGGMVITGVAEKLARPDLGDRVSGCLLSLTMANLCMMPFTPQRRR